MIARSSFLAIAAVLVVPFTTALSPDREIARPLGAAALELEDGVAVEWRPGVLSADVFRVYGVLPHGEAVHLATVDGADAALARFHATVPAGFSTYAVTAVRWGAESAPAVVTLAAQGDSAGTCVTIDPTIPPQVDVGSSCGPGIYRPWLTTRLLP